MNYFRIAAEKCTSVLLGKLQLLNIFHFSSSKMNPPEAGRPTTQVGGTTAYPKNMTVKTGGGRTGAMIAAGAGAAALGYYAYRKRQENKYPVRSQIGK